MTQGLYTIILDFRGGVYASQVDATDQGHAIECWAERLKVDKPIPRVSATVARNVLANLEDGGLTPLNGLQGVWCFSALCGGDLILGNLVRSH